MTCRHPHAWILLGGHAEWCYECGAYRGLRKDGDRLTPRTTWVKPVGKGRENPYKKMRILDCKKD